MPQNKKIGATIAVSITERFGLVKCPFRVLRKLMMTTKTKFIHVVQYQLLHAQ